MSNSVANRYRIKGTAGPVINQAFKLDHQPLQIGRADDCQVRIEHESVSAHHAEITLEQNGKVMLRDLGSAGGTRLNGLDIAEAELGSGDEIQIGNARLMLQAPGLRPARVLTEEATRPSAPRWPWLLGLLIIVAAVAAWQQGWVSLLTGYLSP